MRRFLFVIGLFFISYYGFSQQNIPSRIIGGIPNIDSTQTYRIQVGAFRNTQNANNVSLRLRSIGFNPVHESFFDLTRVLIPNIPAAQIRNHLVRIKSLGFDEVIIRGEGNFFITEKRNISDNHREGLTEDIQNLIPLEILEAIEDLGIQINEGRNPPNIVGTYLVSTLQLVRNTTGGPIANQWNKYVTFSNQDNTTLTINVAYTMQTDQGHGPMNSEGPGSFIVGEGNKFTVVVDGTREQGGFTATTVEIFSGEISADGIINYYWAVMMINNSGNPLGIWIQNGTGYSRRDGSGFSRRIF